MDVIIVCFQIYVNYIQFIENTNPIFLLIVKCLNYLLLFLDYIYPCSQGLLIWLRKLNISSTNTDRCAEGHFKDCQQRKQVIFKSKLSVMKVVKMKTLCAKFVVPGSKNHVLLTIFIYVKKQRLQSNFGEACIELKKISKVFFSYIFGHQGGSF